MAEQYDTNGDFNYGDGSSDFKRREKNATSEKSDDEEDHPIAEKVSEYLRELLSEKVSIDHKYPHAERLLEQEMTKVQQCGRIPQRDQKYVDIYREKQIRVTVKVLVPVKEHPKFNFVGKLLGPKGNSMKRLQEETMCKMAVLGRGSMKDRKKEEELRASLDPKYAHLNDDLHVEISALAPPAEAHARAAYALAEVRKYLIPDSNDCIRQEQMREMIADGTIQAEIPDTEPINPYKPYIPKHRTVSTHPPRAAYPSYGYPPRVATSGPPPRSPTSESYGGYEEPIYEAPPPAAHYDAYYPPVAPTSRSSRYEVQDYEPTEYRRDYYHREATAYPVKTSSGATSRSSWKGSSSGYPSSSRHEETSSSKHSHASGHSGHSHSRDSRYRSSPYTRPSKLPESKNHMEPHGYTRYITH
ncbi:KH domain-containing, RNA-binding, signal transduction-associated protein 3-like isoform X4 [Bradysia coprophila]|uniref:KH domain-containing, RNA-binding, signal transduction-associated protein 3-like isoform X4 n=1 Tax=Bradysia coprophila TaxID=38358 RepID=UPI00187DCA23|nr:KH domain-containing, RNA-binding, signal transduction-associated protein 3-like isoform X4 [Bradysia coprophila]